MTHEGFALPYLSEDDLKTFDGWLKFQGIDTALLTNDEAAAVCEMFNDAVKHRETARKVGRMKLKRRGDSTYAVAIRDGGDLWLALWVRRSAKPEFFIFHPTADGDWNPHSSLHADGAFHMKSHDKKMLIGKRQPPASIKGSEDLGAYGGFAPKSVGAICDPADFTGVFEAPSGVLGPRNGMVAVDLIEPGSGAQPLSHAEEVDRRLFADSVPNVLIRVFRS